MRVRAPHSIEAGAIILCDDEAKIPLAKCGIANPMNAIGPVKAVVAHANRATAIIISILVRVTDIPRPFA